MDKFKFKLVEILITINSSLVLNNNTSLKVYINI